MSDRPRPLFASKREGSQWWAELSESLLWPKLAGAWTLAFRPARIGLSIILLVLIGLLGRVPSLWLNESDPGPLAFVVKSAGEGAVTAVNGVASLRIPLFIDGIAQIAATTPIQTVQRYPWTLAAIALPLMLIVGVLGGAIARTSATEFARGERITWTNAVGFSLGRALSFTGTLAAPLLGALLFTAIVALGGWALLSLAWVQVIGAVLYGVGLILILAAVLLAVGYVFGFPLLIPALACEGTDAIDAIQRTYAYVLGRPVRLIAYTLLSLVMMVMLLAVVGGIGRATITGTALATTVLTSEAPTKAVREQVPGLTKPTSYSIDHLVLGTKPKVTEPSSSIQATSRVIAFWHKVVALLVASVGVSFFFSASTILYLILREANDGQDHTELWTPARSGGFGSRVGEVAQPAKSPTAENLG